MAGVENHTKKRLLFTLRIPQVLHFDVAQFTQTPRPEQNVWQIGVRQLRDPLGP